MIHTFAWHLTWKEQPFKLKTEFWAQNIHEQFPELWSEELVDDYVSDNNFFSYFMLCTGSEMHAAINGSVNFSLPFKSFREIGGTGDVHHAPKCKRPGREIKLFEILVGSRWYSMAKKDSQGKNCENKSLTQSAWPHLPRRRGQQVAEQGFRSLGGEDREAACSKRFVSIKTSPFHFSSSCRSFVVVNHMLINSSSLRLRTFFKFLASLYSLI